MNTEKLARPAAHPSRFWLANCVLLVAVIASLGCPRSGESTGTALLSFKFINNATFPVELWQGSDADVSIANSVAPGATRESITQVSVVDDPTVTEVITVSAHIRIDGTVTSTSIDTVHVQINMTTDLVVSYDGQNLRLTATLPRPTGS